MEERSSLSVKEKWKTRKRLFVQLLENDWNTFQMGEISPRDLKKKGVVYVISTLFPDVTGDDILFYNVHFISALGRLPCTNPNAWADVCKFWAEEVGFDKNSKPNLDGKNVFVVKRVDNYKERLWPMDANGHLQQPMSRKSLRDKNLRKNKLRKRKREKDRSPIKPKKKKAERACHSWIRSNGSLPGKNDSRYFGLMPMETYISNLEGSNEYTFMNYGSRATFIAPRRPDVLLGGIQCKACKGIIPLKKFANLYECADPGQFDFFKKTHSISRVYSFMNAPKVMPCTAWGDEDGYRQTRLQFRRRHQSNDTESQGKNVNIDFTKLGSDLTSACDPLTESIIENMTWLIQQLTKLNANEHREKTEIAIVPVYREDFDILDAEIIKQIFTILHFVEPSTASGTTFWRIPSKYTDEGIRFVCKTLEGAIAIGSNENEEDAQSEEIPPLEAGSPNTVPPSLSIPPSVDVSADKPDLGSRGHSKASLESSSSNQKKKRPLVVIFTSGESDSEDDHENNFPAPPILNRPKQALISQSPSQSIVISSSGDEEESPNCTARPVESSEDEKEAEIDLEERHWRLLAIAKPIFRRLGPFSIETLRDKIKGSVLFADHHRYSDDEHNLDDVMKELVDENILSSVQEGNLRKFCFPSS